MTVRSRSYRVPIALAGLAVVLAAPAAAFHWHPALRGSSALPLRAAPTAMPAATPRPAWLPVDAGAVTSVQDFAMMGDTLAILDQRAARLVLLVAADGHWRAVRAQGRRGGGPGEFNRPRAMAPIGDTALAVLEEGGRLQLFDHELRLVRAVTRAIPCPMFAPTIADAGDGRIAVAGNCGGAGAARDTVFSVLFTARPFESAMGWQQLFGTPRMAVDLSWGASFATLHPLSVSADSLRFGTGLDGCLASVARYPSRSGGAAPQPPHRTCDLVMERLHSDPPASLEVSRAAARRRGDRRMERMLTWPEALPAFWTTVSDGGDLLLVRPISMDSLVFVPAGRPFDAALARLAGPLPTFVTCSDGACVWYDPEHERLALHRFAAPARNSGR